MDSSFFYIAGAVFCCGNFQAAVWEDKAAIVMVKTAVSALRISVTKLYYYCLCLSGYIQAYCLRSYILSICVWVGIYKQYCLTSYHIDGRAIKATVVHNGGQLGGTGPLKHHFN